VIIHPAGLSVECADGPVEPSVGESKRCPDERSDPCLSRLPKLPCALILARRGDRSLQAPIDDPLSKRLLGWIAGPHADGFRERLPLDEAKHTMSIPELGYIDHIHPELSSRLGEVALDEDRGIIA
jgi:hypothetical protein